MATTRMAQTLIRNGISESLEGFLARIIPETIIAITIPWKTTRLQEGDERTSEWTHVCTSCSMTSEKRYTTTQGRSAR